MRRVQRQTLIEGWGQEALDETFLAFFGNGAATNYSALLASCVEIGRSLIVSRHQLESPSSFMGRKISPGDYSPQIASIIRSLNPEVCCESFTGEFLDTRVESYLHHFPDFYVHAENNCDEKRMMIANFYEPPRHLDRLMGKEIPMSRFIFSAGSSTELRAGRFDNLMDARYFMPQFEGQMPSACIALAQAALDIGEVISAKLKIGDTLEDIITWNLCSSKRTSHVSDLPDPEADLSGKKVALIGQGAIGTMYLEAIHDLGLGVVYCYDFDRIELTNFARAPHYVGKLGRYKSIIATNHFNKRQDLDGHLESAQRTLYRSKKQRFTEHTKLPEIDLLVCAVDGYDNQMAVINYSQRNGIPLILGGCTPFIASVFMYVPGSTNSMLLQYDFLKQAYLDSIRHNHPHCNDPEVQGSNVVTTAFCAAVMAGETKNFFGGNPMRGPLMYDMGRNPRLQYTPFTGANDLGKDIPEFSVPDAERAVNEGAEEIKVEGMPFQQWYAEKGNWPILIEKK
jgi:tRNA A37 threonylcarbamoyladenosine dehydratase